MATMMNSQKCLVKCFQTFFTVGKVFFYDFHHIRKLVFPKSANFTFPEYLEHLPANLVPKAQFCFGQHLGSVPTVLGGSGDETISFLEPALPLSSRTDYPG